MKNMKFLLGAMLTISLNALAQVHGDIVDQKDSGIPNAIIIAIDTVTKVADTVKSDKRGFYEFKSLKPGKYKIEVRVNGYKTAVIENITVKEGDTGTFDLDIYHGQRLDITLFPAKLP